MPNRWGSLIISNKSVFSRTVLFFNSHSLFLFSVVQDQSFDDEDGDLKDKEVIYFSLPALLIFNVM